KGLASLVPTTDARTYLAKGASGFVGGASSAWICVNTAGLGCVVGGGSASGALSQMTENLIMGEKWDKDVLASMGAGIIGQGVEEFGFDKVVGRKPDSFWIALTKKHGQSEWIKALISNPTEEMFKGIFSE